MVLVKNANRMMTTASLLDDGIELSFADGHRGPIPYGEVPEVREPPGRLRLGVAQPLRDGPANSPGVRASKFPGTLRGTICHAILSGQPSRQ